jgi:hypothetical protein
MKAKSSSLEIALSAASNQRDYDSFSNMNLCPMELSKIAPFKIYCQK